MLDLKAKLAAAGLVTKKDVARAEKAKQGGKRKKKRGGRGGGKGDGGPSRLRIKQLRDKPKGEQYDAVRRFIERVRLEDPGRLPTEAAKPFHFTTAKGQIGRMVLEPEVYGWVTEGGAGIVAFMSNHGLAHAAVPAAAARDLAELFPLWLRVLKGHSGAGQLEQPPEPEPENRTATTAEDAAPSSPAGSSDND
ncbi:MAG: hypothetical protein AAF799_28165 [Myxococcota bacterium]